MKILITNLYFNFTLQRTHHLSCIANEIFQKKKDEHRTDLGSIRIPITTAYNPHSIRIVSPSSKYTKIMCDEILVHMTSNYSAITLPHMDNNLKDDGGQILHFSLRLTPALVPYLLYLRKNRISLNEEVCCIKCY